MRPLFSLLGRELATQGVMSIDSDDLDDRDLPDPSDMDQDDYTVMSRCPYCRKMIAEDSEICPLCGQFISTESAPRKYPVWAIILIVAALVAMLFGYLI